MSISEILRHEQRLIAAVASRDLAALDELLHDDLLFNLPNGETATKAMDLEAHRSGAMTVTKITSEEPRVQLFGDTAVVAVTVALEGRYMGHPLDGRYRYLRVWKKEGDAGWKIIGGSCVGM